VDLTPLAQLKNLQLISLKSNLLISIDLSPLQQSLKLQTLNFEGNKIEAVNLRPLAQCTLLEKLDLEGNRLAKIDLNPLSKAINLQTLSLGSNLLGEIDLRPLGESIGLQILNLKKNKLTRLNFQPLKQLKGLQVLILKDNLLAELDLRPLNECTGLRTLDLSANKLTSAYFPDTLTNITELRLSSNELTKINYSELCYLISNNLNMRLSLEDNPWDGREFRKQLTEIDPSLKYLMENLARTLFPEHLAEVTTPFSEQIYGWDREKLKQAHSFWLEIGNTSGRAIYGTVLTTAIIRYSVELFGEQINITVFILALLIFNSAFIASVLMAYRVEKQVREEEDIYVIKRSKFPLASEAVFETNLKTYMSLERELRENVAKSVSSFSVNLAAIAISILIFLFLSLSGEAELPLKIFVWVILPLLVLFSMAIAFSMKIVLDKFPKDLKERFDMLVIAHRAVLLERGPSKTNHNEDMETMAPGSQ
jgi:Leucine-rich repeat (LRR) protein